MSDDSIGSDQQHEQPKKKGTGPPRCSAPRPQDLRVLNFLCSWNRSIPDPVVLPTPTPTITKVDNLALKLLHLARNGTMGAEIEAEKILLPLFELPDYLALIQQRMKAIIATACLGSLDLPGGIPTAQTPSEAHTQGMAAPTKAAETASQTAEAEPLGSALKKNDVESSSQFEDSIAAAREKEDEATARKLDMDRRRKPYNLISQLWKRLGQAQLPKDANQRRHFSVLVIELARALKENYDETALSRLVGKSPTENCAIAILNRAVDEPILDTIDAMLAEAFKVSPSFGNDVALFLAQGMREDALHAIDHKVFMDDHINSVARQIYAGIPNDLLGGFRPPLQLAFPGQAGMIPPLVGGAGAKIAGANVVGQGKSDAGNDAAPKGKRSTQKGDAEAKIIPVLTAHHKYAEDGALNLEPIGNNELARNADVDKASASAFFKKHFKGHGKYTALCRDSKALVNALKVLNGDFSPHHLFGGTPANEAEHRE